MLLVAAMLGVPLVSFVIDDTVPGVRVEASAPSDVNSLDLERPRSEGVSRARIALVGAEVVATTTTAPPTTVPPPPTTAPPTTAKPTTTTAKPTTTTAKPTTTTAKPTTTTAKPTTTTAKPTTTTVPPSRSEEGQASYYAANDPAECAHRTLPLGTIVTVTNVENRNQTTCRVGDRGPFVDGRVIDLSRERFAELAPLSEGVISVRIEW